MKEYHVTFRTSEKTLGTLIQAVLGSADLVSVAEAPARPDAPAPRTLKYANGKKNKGISSEDLVLKLLRERGAMTTKELSNAFVFEGFAPGSYSPAICRLGTRLRRRDDGRVELATA